MIVTVRLRTPILRQLKANEIVHKHFFLTYLVKLAVTPLILLVMNFQPLIRSLHTFAILMVYNN